MRKYVEKFIDHLGNGGSTNNIERVSLQLIPLNLNEVKKGDDILNIPDDHSINYLENITKADFLSENCLLVESEKYYNFKYNFENSEIDLKEDDCFAMYFRNKTENPSLFRLDSSS